MKVWQKFPKVAQKLATSVFTCNELFFKIAQKQKYILVTFLRKYVTKNFQKSHNLVTLSTTIVRKRRMFIVRWMFIVTNKLRIDRVEQQCALGR